MVLAFCAALLVAASVLVVFGPGDHGTLLALFLTGRVSFLLFWPAYAGSALCQLFGAAFGWVKRRGREFGLAFVAAQSVHLGLVAWLCYIGHAPGLSTFVLFGIAAGWVYLLALCSIGRVQQALGARLWWVVRTIGMHYILFAFAFDFLHDPLAGGAKRVAAYLPFAVLSVAGPVLRLGAFALRFGHAPKRMGSRG
jgi:voltage-gated potassium channel Kch